MSNMFTPEQRQELKDVMKEAVSEAIAAAMVHLGPAKPVSGGSEIVDVTATSSPDALGRVRWYAAEKLRERYRDQGLDTKSPNFPAKYFYLTKTLDENKDALSETQVAHLTQNLGNATAIVGANNRAYKFDKTIQNNFFFGPTVRWERGDALLDTASYSDRDLVRVYNSMEGRIKEILAEKAVDGERKF